MTVDPRTFYCKPTSGEFATIAQAIADERERCARIAENGAKQCSEGNSEWHRGFRYAATNTALKIADAIRRSDKTPTEE